MTTPMTHPQLDPVGTRSTAGRPRAGAGPLEEHELTRLVDRLTAAFPGARPGEVATAVRRQHGRFLRCRVRTYVPVLVERAARAELGGHERR